MIISENQQSKIQVMSMMTNLLFSFFLVNEFKLQKLQENIENLYYSIDIFYSDSV